VTEFQLTSNLASKPDPMKSNLTTESTLLRVFVALFVQLQLILAFSLFSGRALIFVPKYRFQGDFTVLFAATSDWLHKADPYLRGQVLTNNFVTPPPSLLVTLSLQLFSLRTASVLFLIVNVGIVAASLWSVCRWFEMTQRETLLFFGVASTYFPITALLERGNLDGIMLGLMLISLFTRNRFGRVVVLSLSISIKIYSIMLLAPLVLARRWKQVSAVVLLVALLLLSFHSLFWSFVHSQATRSAAMRTAWNLSPFGIFGPSRESRAAVLVYLALWIVSYSLMLFRNRGANLTVKALYSFPWMLAMPLQVFPYTGVLLLPLLALKSREIAERGFATVRDSPFLIGFCLVGLQQTAISECVLTIPHGVRLADALNPLGTVLVIGSLVFQSTRSKLAGRELAHASA